MWVWEQDTSGIRRSKLLVSRAGYSEHLNEARIALCEHVKDQLLTPGGSLGGGYPKPLTRNSQQRLYAPTKGAPGANLARSPSGPSDSSHLRP